MLEQCHSDKSFLSYDWWQGDKDPTPVRCASRRMVTTRRERLCVSHDGTHICPPKTRGLHEKAIVDGAWKEWFMCIPCMSAWFQEIGYNDQLCHPVDGSEEDADG